MINRDVKHVRFYARPTRDFAFTCVLSVDTYVSLFSDKFIKLPNLLLLWFSQIANSLTCEVGLKFSYLVQAFFSFLTSSLND